MHTRCARFPVAGLGPRRRFGSGAGYPGPGTRYQALVFEKPAHGVCIMQDSDYLVPGTRHLALIPNFPTSNLNKALLVTCHFIYWTYSRPSDQQGVGMAIATGCSSRAARFRRTTCSTRFIGQKGPHMEQARV